MLDHRGFFLPTGMKKHPSWGCAVGLSLMVVLVPRDCLVLLSGNCKAGLWGRPVGAPSGV